jgi:predicted permease
MALITGAGLLIRSFAFSQSISPGFDTSQQMLIAHVARAGGAGVSAGVFYEQLASEIEALPGVDRVTWARRINLATSGGGAAREVQFPEQDPINIKYNQVAPNYFEVMGTRILRGRPFVDADREGAAPVAIVNETMAERFWPTADPLGATLRIRGVAHEVVAIVEDGKINNLHEPAEPLFYLPYAQSPSGDTTLLIATDGDAGLAAPAVAELLRDREGELLNLGLVSLEQHMRQALYADRMPAQIGAALGLLGVLLASVGLYGVISRLVNQRQREFGIRMALGAQRSGVLKLVLAQGLKLSLVGVGVGIGLAQVVGRLMASSLHGVGSVDPLVLLVSCAIVVVVGLAASHVPTRRATRVDPMEVLRNDA